MYNFIIESDFEIQACDKLIFPSKNNKFEIIKYRRLTQEKKAEIYYCSTYDMFTLKYYPLVAYETDKYIILRYLDYYFVAISLNDNEIIVDLDSVDPKMSVNVAIKEQSPEICMAAVKRNGHALQFVKEQTPELCLVAVRQNSDALKFVRNKTPEIRLAAKR